jgi:hypothetical protein
MLAAAVGCGNVGSGSATQAAGETETSAHVASSTPPVAEHSVVASPPGAEGTIASEYVATPEGLPPEISVSAASTQVLPGGVVQVTAQGSDDVEEVVMWDGIGKKQPLLYDEGLKVWRGYYRVPIRPTTDRLGLSLTATNASHRWRRVWLFLNVERETPVSTSTDSLK